MNGHDPGLGSSPVSLQGGAHLGGDAVTAWAGTGLDALVAETVAGAVLPKVGEGDPGLKRVFNTAGLVREPSDLREAARQMAGGRLGSFTPTPEASVGTRADETGTQFHGERAGDNRGHPLDRAALGWERAAVSEIDGRMLSGSASQSLVPSVVPPAFDWMGVAQRVGLPRAAAVSIERPSFGGEGADLSAGAEILADWAVAAQRWPIVGIAGREPASADAGGLGRFLERAETAGKPNGLGGFSYRSNEALMRSNLLGTVGGRSDGPGRALTALIAAMSEASRIASEPPGTERVEPSSGLGSGSMLIDAARAGLPRGPAVPSPRQFGVQEGQGVIGARTLTSQPRERGDLPGLTNLAARRDGAADETGSSRPAGVVMLDGRLVGQWMMDRLGREAARPSAGMTGFNARQHVAWSVSGSVA